MISNNPPSVESCELDSIDDPYFVPVYDSSSIVEVQGIDARSWHKKAVLETGDEPSHRSSQSSSEDAQQSQQQRQQQQCQQHSQSHILNHNCYESALPKSQFPLPRCPRRSKFLPQHLQQSSYVPRRQSVQPCCNQKLHPMQQREPHQRTRDHLLPSRITSLASPSRCCNSMRPRMPRRRRMRESLNHAVGPTLTHNPTSLTSKIKSSKLDTSKLLYCPLCEILSHILLLPLCPLSSTSPQVSYCMLNQQCCPSSQTPQQRKALITLLTENSPSFHAGVEKSSLPAVKTPFAVLLHLPSHSSFNKN